MPWTIGCNHAHVAFVTMNTNKVNAQDKHSVTTCMRRCGIGIGYRVVCSDPASTHARARRYRELTDGEITWALPGESL